MSTQINKTKEDFSLEMRPWSYFSRDTYDITWTCGCLTSCYLLLERGSAGYTVLLILSKYNVKGEGGVKKSQEHSTYNVNGPEDFLQVNQWNKWMRSCLAPVSKQLVFCEITKYHKNDIIGRDQ